MVEKCSAMARSRRVQTLLNASWLAHMDDQILNHGGLKKNALSKFEKDFRRGFMTKCRSRRKKASTKLKGMSPFG